MQLMLRYSFALLAATTLVFPQDIDPDLVLFSQDRTLYVGEPVLLDMPNVDLALWSATGRHLLYQKSFEGRRTVHIANLANVRSAGVNIPTTEPVNTIASAWLPKSSWLVVAMGEGEGKSLYWVNAANATANELRPWGDYKPLTTLLSVSPSEPLAILSVLLPGPTVGGAELEAGTEAFVEKCFLLDGTGTIRELKAPLTGFGVSAMWSTDGKRAFVSKPLPPDQPPADELFELDLSGREATLVKEEDIRFAPDSLQPAKSVSARIGLSRVSNAGTQRDIHPLWLETRGLDGPNRILVSANAQWGQVSPDEKTVAYLVDGALVVRRISDIDRDSYTEALSAKVRYVAMSELKEIGLAITILGSENENLLPPPSTFRDEVRGFLEDARILERFVYTFPGGRVTELREPSKMEIGFIPLKDGRVVLYADNSVKWVPL